VAEDAEKTAAVVEAIVVDRDGTAHELLRMVTEVTDAFYGAGMWLRSGRYTISSLHWLFEACPNPPRITPAS
jgi:hypothetical protein